MLSDEIHKILNTILIKLDMMKELIQSGNVLVKHLNIINDAKNFEEVFELIEKVILNYVPTLFQTTYYPNGCHSCFSGVKQFIKAPGW